MKDFELKLCRAESVEFVNKLPSNVKIELTTKVSYNVGYSKINTCQGEIRVEVTDKNSPERFRIVVVMKGFFTLKNNTPKEKLHVMTYDSLYPFVKSFIVNLTSNAGISPVYIPYIDISEKSIYKMEVRKDFNSTENSNDQEDEK